MSPGGFGLYNRINHFFTDTDMSNHQEHNVLVRDVLSTIHNSLPSHITFEKGNTLHCAQCGGMMPLGAGAFMSQLYALSGFVLAHPREGKHIMP